MDENPGASVAYVILFAGSLFIGWGLALSLGPWSDPRPYDPGVGLLTAGATMAGLSAVALAIATRRNGTD